MQRESGYTKRKKKSVSSSPDTSGLLEFKKARHLSESSIESEEQSDFEDCSEIIESEQEINNSEGEPQEIATMSLDEDKLLDKISKMLDDRLAKVKSDIVKEVTSTMQKHIETLETKVFTVEKENDKMKKELQAVKVSVETKSEALKKSERDCKDLTARVVELEQYSRRENIKIFGLMESRDEDIKEEVMEFLTKKMKCDVDEADVNAVHRLDTKSQASIINGARPVIVRFTSRDIKLSVMKARKILKGSRVFVSDHLCKSMNALFNRVRKDPQVENAWSWDGSVFFKSVSGRVYKIRYGQTVEDVVRG